jgi:hypothetical protein
MRYTFWLESLKGSDHSEDLIIDDRIISKQIFKKYGGRMWSGLIWLKTQAAGGL